MGTFSKAIAVWLIILVGMVEAFPQDTPDMVLGTEAGTYKLFTPTEVVKAGGGGGGGEVAADVYRFFSHEDISITEVTTDTVVNAGRKLALGGLAKTTYSDGLGFGPFYTFFEGDISINLGSRGTATLEMSVIHTFTGDKILTTKRDISVSNIGQNGYDFGLNQFNSVFDLKAGEITLDDGSKLDVTKELLAEPVSIAVTFTIAFLQTETVENIVGENTAVAWVQLANEVSAGGDLSDKTPLIESGSGAAGSGTMGSRDDHVHPAAGGGGGASLSDKTPVIESGTGAAGSGTMGSRDDHVHPNNLPGGVYPVGTAGYCLKSGTAGARGTGALRYGDCGSPRPLSNKDPVVDGTVAPGTGTRVSRDDHVHPARTDVAVLSDATPKTVVDGGAPFSKPGTGTKASRDDHIHSGRTQLALSNDAPADTTHTGDASPGTGERAARIDHNHRWSAGRHNSNQKGYVLTLASNDVNGAISWEAPAPGPLSDVTPLADGTAAPGTGTMGSREDHIHPEVDPFPTAASDNQLLAVKSANDGTREWKDPHTAVLSGLPAISGHGGNVLTVNTGATGVEWKAAGGGSGGGTLGLGSSEHYFSQLGNVAGTTTTSVTYAGSTCNDLRDLIETESRWISFLTFSNGNTEYRYSPPIWATFSSITHDTYGFIGTANNGTGTPVEMHFSMKSDDNCTWTADSAVFTTDADKANTIDIWAWTISGSGGGGGGDTNPTIPKPTAAGELKHLRVAAGGAAYELADPPVPLVLTNSAGAAVSGAGGGAGTAKTAARQDHTHKVELSSVDPDTTDGTPASAGTSDIISRSDHRHKLFLSNAEPQVITATAKAGASTTPARDDHAHSGGNLYKPSQLAGLENGFVWSTAACELNINTNKTECVSGWRRPQYWQRETIYSDESVTWSSHNKTISVMDTNYDLHAFMENELSFREFEINIRWAHQSKTRFQTIKVAGLTHGNKLGPNEDAIFYSLNSNNTISGNIQFARIEVPHEGAWTIHIGFNSGGASTVSIHLVGIR